jgi:hypothetical protein
MSFSWETYHSLLWSAIAITCAALAGVLLHHLLSRVAQRVADRPGGAQEHVLISLIARPMGALLPIVVCSKLDWNVCRHCGCEVLT